MRFRNDQKGFSLIEMIIVFAIIGIMAGFAIRVTGYLKLANSEKATKTLEGALGKQQAKAMSKGTKNYLYIYEISGTYYVCASEVNCSSRDVSVMSKDSGSVLGNNMTIYSVKPDGTRTKIEGSTILQIFYKRDGTFGSFVDDAYQTILIEGSFPKEIKLIRDTGRYIVRDVVSSTEPE